MSDDPRSQFEQIKANGAKTAKPRRKRAGKYERIGIVCVVCGFSFSHAIARHHILPVSEGGKNDSDNLIWLCANCHAVIHSLKKWLARNYFDNHQMTRANKQPRWVNRVTNDLLKHYTTAQTEILWQIAEETYGR